jgi:hypothetical protein
MLKLAQPRNKVYKPSTPETYLGKAYCSKCDTKRTKPCECRSNKLKLNPGI